MLFSTATLNKTSAEHLKFVVFISTFAVLQATRFTFTSNPLVKATNKLRNTKQCQKRKKITKNLNTDEL